MHLAPRRAGNRKDWGRLCEGASATLPKWLQAVPNRSLWILAERLLSQQATAQATAYQLPTSLASPAPPVVQYPQP